MTEASQPSDREQAAAAEADRADAAYARRLRDALGGLGILSTLAAPHTQTELLDLLVRNAMQITSARIGTLRLLDPATNELVFEVLQGPSLPPNVLDAARNIRIPLGEGLAGWVAASGQPIVRSDLANDPRYAAEAQRRLGYVPNSTLCLPLTSDDGILGVIELFDKAHGEPFSAADMDVLGLFGEAAAAAIKQSQLLNDVTKLFRFMLERLLSDTSDQALLQDRASEFVGRAIQESSFRDAIQIALTAGQIARQGPDARRFCLHTLEGFADYLRNQRVRETVGGLLS